jgi:hypothetical protein
MDIEVNVLAVLLAAVASMVLGFLWYSKMLFGAKWASLKGYTDESLKAAQAGMGKLYGVSFVVAIITAYVLAHVMGLAEAFYNYPMVQTGFTSTLWMWLGFVMPVQLTGQIFGEKKWKLLAIDTGYQLASLVVMGIVIGLMN